MTIAVYARDVAEARQQCPGGTNTGSGEVSGPTEARVCGGRCCGPRGGSRDVHQPDANSSDTGEALGASIANAVNEGGQP